MGSDDIIKKRKLETQKLREARKQSKRTSRNFNEIPRILVLTEGLSEKIYFEKIKSILGITTLDVVMCAEKTGGFNLVNYRHSSGVYHEQETEDLHRRI